MCYDTEDAQVIRNISNVLHITRKGLIDGITKRITTRSQTYITKIEITKNITGGNSFYSTRMDQTANITKHLTASDIPLFTMTSKKVDQVQFITKNATEGKNLYSTRMDQTSNITKHFIASDIPLSTMTGKTNLVKAFSD